MVEPRFVQLANALADAARPIAARYFRTQVAIDDKTDNSPVTIADREAETAMRDLLQRHVPEHGVFGEEHGAVRTDAEYVWVLDPIDGTKAFITGLPIFGTLVALLHRGKPVMGIIDQPILKERWLGVEGQRSTFNGTPIGWPLKVDCRPATPSQRSLRIGWSITPITGTPRWRRAISVPKIGRPVRKALVPSIGSSTHTNSASARSLPSSSPTMPCDG